MRTVLLYTTLRLAAFVATAAVLAGLNALFSFNIRPLVILAAAVLVSGVASWWVLARQRAALAETLAAGSDRLRSGVESAASREDEPVATRAAAPAATPASAGIRAEPPAQDATLGEGSVDDEAEREQHGVRQL